MILELTSYVEPFKHVRDLNDQSGPISVLHAELEEIRRNLSPKLTTQSLKSIKQIQHDDNAQFGEESSLISGPTTPPDVQHGSINGPIIKRNVHVSGLDLSNGATVDVPNESCDADTKVAVTKSTDNPSNSGKNNNLEEDPIVTIYDYIAELDSQTLNDASAKPLEESTNSTHNSETSLVETIPREAAKEIALSLPPPLEEMHPRRSTLPLSSPDSAFSPVKKGLYRTPTIEDVQDEFDITNRRRRWKEREEIVIERRDQLSSHTTSSLASLEEENHMALVLYQGDSEDHTSDRQPHGNTRAPSFNPTESSSAQKAGKKV
jgi:hypothetical protein